MCLARQYSMKHVGHGISLMDLILGSIFRAVASPYYALVYTRKGCPLWVGAALLVCGLPSGSQG